MTIETWLQQAQHKLKTSGVETARLDCLILLEDCLNKNRTQLLARPELKISNEHQKYLWARVGRRTNHEPLAYIRGKVEFYGREFIVNKHVLVPRPESETIIDLLKATRLPGHPHIVDVGSGSGALGITIKIELPDVQVDLIDIDQAAMHLAQKNINKFSVSVGCFVGDLLSPTDTLYDVVIANLPYVPDALPINRAAQAEPRLAIFGGPDGLDIYRHMFDQLQTLERKPLIVLTESLPQQHPMLAKIAENAGYKLTKTDGFIQQFGS